MSLATYAAPFNNDQTSNETNETNDTNEITRKKITRNKTLKKRDLTEHSRVQAIKDSLNVDIEEGSPQMGDFHPLPQPKSAGMERQTSQPTSVNQTKNSDAPITVDSFNQLDSDAINDYYQQTVPNFNKLVAPQDSNTEIINKLNQMLHLLQEQQETKTSTVTEEVILYSFLGVFVIFVLDSFARAGKYVR
jgi:hypothetical protein